MNVLLVAVDLDPGRNLGQVQAFIDQFDNMRFSENTHAIQTSQGPNEVFEQLQPLLGPDDLAYVVRLERPWMGYGYEAMNTWLKRHLG